MPEQHLFLGEISLRIGNAHFARITLRDEGTHFVAESRILGRKREFHRNAPYHLSPNGLISNSNVQALRGC